MSERAPYSRVYWTVRNDPRLADIYSDDHHWAAWNRLLLAADMAWPAPADLPGSVRRASLSALVSAGVVELLPGGLFRFHGLDAERGERRIAATRLRLGQSPNRDPDGTQTGPNRDPDGPGVPGRRRAELSRDEPSIAREGLGAVTPEVADAWEAASGRTVLASGAFAAGLLDDLSRRHPMVAIVTAIRLCREDFDHVPSTQQLAARVRNLLDPLPSSKTNGKDDAAAREAAEIEAGRRRVEATLAKTHEFGAHVAEPNPRCPTCAAVTS
jgi:hypothetical protein